MATKDITDAGTDGETAGSGVGCVQTFPPLQEMEGDQRYIDIHTGRETYDALRMLDEPDLDDN